MKITDVSHHDIFHHAQHCINQIATRALSDGTLVAVFNEERFGFHHDSGQTLLSRSADGGVTWSAPEVVLPWTETTGNWDCGICELADGTLDRQSDDRRLLQARGPGRGRLLAQRPHSRGVGRLDLVVQDPVMAREPMWSSPGTRGETWSQPIPVNVRPLKHGGCRLGCWQLPSGSILMGLYGRIRGYGEEGEGETTRSALMRSDDGGDNWECFSTLAFDPASIIDYEEPSMLRLAGGRLVSFMRTHVNPSGDARNLVFVVSDDDGFSWTPPKWTNIWGYPAETIRLQDGRHLMIYGYRRPPYGVQGVVSEDGVTWDDKNSFFFVAENGVPGKEGTASAARRPSDRLAQSRHLSAHRLSQRAAAFLADGTIVASYHQWEDRERPLQFARATRFRLSD